ncbi:extended synaptotagmin-2-A isoform X1 [Electrophorus electricus]|uniref:extended synaptotagmin-2-A isoform X1 n=1 Tax=Electrophorus electricus TaxID=8005 RepID=UPI0015CFA7E0|nr:extended synaptotagmin-2-A isoform X1 [Electrophorus electricus]
MCAAVNGVDPKPETPKQNGPSSNPYTLNSKTDSLADLEPDSEPPSSVEDAKNTGIKFAKTFLLVLPIYVLGYFEFSFSWILVGLAVLFWLKRNQGTRFQQVNRALAFFEHEEKEIRQTLPTSELPPWVHFPDVERVEWLNKTVLQMWPYICQFVDKLFRDTIEPAVKGANAHLSSFCFSKIDMGDKPLRINGVKVYTENVDKRQIIMDLQISFVGNTEIDVEIRKYYCKAGIKSIQLHGVLRVIMEPLLGNMPLIGALSVFFLKKPMLDINWTGLTNILDIPGLNDLSDGIIEDIICSYLVLPNRITIPLVGNEEILAQLRFPVPMGVLRVHFLEAQDLIAKDTYLGGLIKGKSDPYGVIKIGNQLFHSKVIKDCLNPKWNEVFEGLVYDQPEQNLQIELYDEDPDEDDFLGRLVIDLKEMQKEQKVDEWFVLDEVTSGKLHLKMEWLTLLSTPDKIDQVLCNIRADRGQANDGLSSALLLVNLDSAKNLPSVFEGDLGSGCLKERRSAGLVFCENTATLYRTLFRNPLEFNHAGLKESSIDKALKSAKKVSSDPSPLVQFRVGSKTAESKIRYKTNEPVWEETFVFHVHNPKTQELEVEVKDEKHECSLGTLTVPLTELLEAENMSLSQRFPLKSAGPSATLKMKLVLKVLSLEKSLASDHLSSLQVRNQAANAIPNASNSNLPQKTSNSKNTPKPSNSAVSPKPPSQLPSSIPEPAQPIPERTPLLEPKLNSTQVEDSPVCLAHIGRSSSNLAISGSQLHLNSKEPTPSIASDISNPYAAQELQHRLQELHNGSSTSYYPLGEVQLTVRHSLQRNKLIVVVHSCRNLIAFSDSGSDPYVRLYLLPDKRRSGRRKTSTVKKTLNPVYDQTFEFSVSLVELHKRTLDIAVKNGGGILSKHKGLLGKVLVDLSSVDISKSVTQWYELSEDGVTKPSFV